MSDWKPLPSSRMARRHPMGYLVVVPVDRTDPVPLECPVCEILMRDREDVLSYNKNKCCSYCEMMWAYPNLKEWSQGWRPDPNEIDRVRKQRVPSPTYSVS